MRSHKKIKPVKSSFPWKAVFGAISILGVMILLSSPKDQNFGKEQSNSETTHGLSGFGIKR